MNFIILKEDGILKLTVLNSTKIVFCGFLIFTLTISVINMAVFPSSASAAVEDLSARDYDSETVDASREAKENISGFWGGVAGFLTGIFTWVVNQVTAFTQAVTSVFRFEKGEGPQAIFGGALYAFIIIVFIFFGKFFFNIARDGIKSVVHRFSPPADRYRKPDFRQTEKKS